MGAIYRINWRFLRPLELLAHEWGVDGHALAAGRAPNRPKSETNGNIAATPLKGSCGYTAYALNFPDRKRRRSAARRAAEDAQRMAPPLNGDKNAAVCFFGQIRSDFLDGPDARQISAAHRQAHCGFARGVYRRHRAFREALNGRLRSSTNLQAADRLKWSNRAVRADGLNDPRPIPVALANARIGRNQCANSR